MIKCCFQFSCITLQTTVLLSVLCKLKNPTWSYVIKIAVKLYLYIDIILFSLFYFSTTLFYRTIVKRVWRYFIVKG